MLSHYISQDWFQYRKIHPASYSFSAKQDHVNDMFSNSTVSWRNTRSISFSVRDISSTLHIMHETKKFATFWYVMVRRKTCLTLWSLLNGGFQDGGYFFQDC